MLAPQHFQAFARRHEILQSYHANQIQPFHWGVDKVEFDEVLLAEGTCRVLQLDALMPDGTPISHPSSQSDDLDLDLSEAPSDDQTGTITVYAAVPARASVSGDDRLPDRYHSVDGSPVVDSVTGTRSIRIPRRVPHLQLLATDPPPSEYVCLPLAKIRTTDDGFAHARYEPPRLRVTMQSAIGNMCRSLTRDMREKIRSLVDRIRSSVMDPGSVDQVETERKVQMLSAGLPRLEAQLRSERTHPFVLYQTLCDVAGQVSGLTRRMLPPTFSPYDHYDLQSSYMEILTYIDHALGEGVQQTYIPIRFRRTEEGFALLFEEEWRDRDLILGVRGRPEQSEQDIQQWGTHALIGAANRIDEMRERRILGVRRASIDEADNLLPARGTALFRLDPASNFIQDEDDLIVRRGEEDDLKNRPIELILYVKEEAS